MGFCEEIQRSANDGSFTYCHRLVESEQQNPQAAKQAIRQLVCEFPGQRIGLFCANDFFAQRVYCACCDMELQVPEQIGIIGFDGLGLVLPGECRLTTVAQDFYQIGKSAAEIIICQLETPQQKPEIGKANVSLQLGDTTAPAD